MIGCSHALVVDWRPCRCGYPGCILLPIMRCRSRLPPCVLAIPEFFPPHLVQQAEAARKKADAQQAKAAANPVMVTPVKAVTPHDVAANVLSPVDFDHVTVSSGGTSGSESPSVQLGGVGDEAPTPAEEVRRAGGCLPVGLPTRRPSLRVFVSPLSGRLFARDAGVG